MEKTPITWLTYYSAIVSTAVALWQVYTYVRSKERLRLLVLTNRMRTGTDDENRYIDVDVTNIGKATTTIQMMFIQAYDGWWNLLRGKTAYQATVSDGPYGNETPCELTPAQVFRGAILQDDHLVGLSRSCRLYVGIKHTMSLRLARKRVGPIFNA